MGVESSLEDVHLWNSQAVSKCFLKHSSFKCMEHTFGFKCLYMNMWGSGMLSVYHCSTEPHVFSVVSQISFKAWWIMGCLFQPLVLPVLLGLRTIFLLCLCWRPMYRKLIKPEKKWEEDNSVHIFLWYAFLLFCYWSFNIVCIWVTISWYFMDIVTDWSKWKTSSFSETSAQVCGGPQAQLPRGC